QLTEARMGRQSATAISWRAPLSCCEHIRAGSQKLGKVPRLRLCEVENNLIVRTEGAQCYGIEFCADGQAVEGGAPRHQARTAGDKLTLRRNGYAFSLGHSEDPRENPCLADGQPV